MDNRLAFEHKQWNERIAAIVRGGEVPPEHMPQCQQVLMVSEAEVLLFVVSDGTADRMVSVEVRPDLEWFERICAGWDQFESDLSTYVPAESEPVAPIGKAPETLPALRIEISGEVTASNLDEFKMTALTAIRAVNRELVTDQHFADADKSIKWCEDVETRVKAAKEFALSQTATIDMLFKTLDDISAEARTVRLDLDKLVTRRKTERKDEIVRAGKAAYDEHVAALKVDTAGLWINLTPPDFVAAAKNKRSFASLQDAVDTALANGKIDADASARKIRAALTCIATEGKDFDFLFADKALLIHKPIDDLTLIVQTRIATHKEAEAAKKRAVADEEIAAAARVTAAAAATPAPAPAPEPAFVVAAAQLAAAPVSTGYRVPDSVRAAVLRPAVVDNRPPITTGALCDFLKFIVTAEFVKGLGIVPAAMPATAKGRSGTYWNVRDIPAIKVALQQHLAGLPDGPVLVIEQDAVAA
jgi:hypothetical protein